MHREASQKVKLAAKELGLKQVPLDDACAANGMTAVSPDVRQKVLSSSRP